MKEPFKPEKPQNKLHDIQNKHNTLTETQTRQQQKEKRTIIDNLSKKNCTLFPSIDQLPSEKVFEAYTRLYESYKKLLNDKEVAINSLKMEIVANDQQRNYIEILKQTIESSLIKSGLKEQIDEDASISGKDFYSNVIEISSLQNEIEKLKNDNTSQEIIISKLKNEVEFANKSNANFKEKIQESLESGIKELEEAKNKIQLLENEKANLISQLNESNEYNERLKSIVEKFESENNETNSKIIKMQKNFQEKIKEQVSNYTKAKEENSKLNQLKYELIQNADNLKENKKVLGEKIEMLQKENEFLSNDNQNLKEINSELSQEKKSKETLLQNIQLQMQKLQSVNNELSSEIQKVRYQLQNTLEAQSKIEKENQYLRTEMEKLSHNSKGFLPMDSAQSLKSAIYNSLNAGNAFLQQCKNNPSLQKINNNALVELVNCVNNIISKFEGCYQEITSDQQFTNYESLIKELKSYKADNKKLYEHQKSLVEENAKSFYIGKENKFYLKLLTKILKYYIQNQEIKNIFNQMISLHSNAIYLEIDKNKIESRIEALMINQQENQNEIENSKAVVKELDAQIQDKFIQLKGLDTQIKKFEKQQCK